MAPYAYPPGWNYRPYYPAGVPDRPIEYIEKTDDPASPRRGWLFCRPAMAYYPYVTDCAESWEFAPVQPPAPS